MSGYKRILLLILIMAVVVTATTGVALTLLYDTAFEEERARLTDTVKVQARLMEAVARFDSQFSQYDHPEGAAAATISQIKDALENFTGFGETGDFLLARGQGEMIVFILTRRHQNVDEPKPVPFDSDLAEPMRRALLGRSGSLVGPDYRGKTVLAAYEPVAVLKLGVVAKIDLAEIRAPFIRTGAVVSAIAFLIVMVGTGFFFLVSDPMIRHLEESEDRNTRARSASDLSRRLAKGLTIRYVLTLVVLAALSLSAHFITQQMIASNDSSAALINASGRQRMLSQRVWLLAEQLIHDPAERKATRNALLKSVDLMEKSHNTLIDSFPELNLPDTLVEELRAVYFGPNKFLDREVRTYLEHARVLAATPETDLHESNPNILYLIGMGSKSLLRALDAVVIWHQGQSEKWVATMRRIHTSVLLITLSVLLMLGLGVLRPMVSRVRQDIEEREQAEEELKAFAKSLEQRTSELKAVNQELEAFSYSVSHDLRGPLRTMDGFSHALLEDYGDKLDAEGKDYLQRVRAGSQKMAQLIDDLLKLSRVTRGEPEHRKVDLSKLVQTVAAELQESAPERQVTFDIAPGVTAEGDTRMIRIALENLLGNALKVTAKHDHATIEFGITNHDGEPAYFVRDDGAGFDMAYADKLFQPFQRLHSGAEFGGTGVGLATVQRIIGRHGGRVWAEAAVEKGATVYFTLNSGRKTT